MNGTARPAISVVVPLYNKRQYVLRCLESIQRQTVADFEAIVIDDGSSDGSAAVARSIGDERFRVMTQPNAGPGSTRNRGVAEAASDVVSFLDADDEWEPGFLEAVLNLARLYPAAGIFATGYRRIMDTGHIRETTVKCADASDHCLVRDYFRLARQGDFVTCSSVAIPKRVFVDAGGFLPGERFGEDRDLWARIGARHAIAVDRRILATYHSEADNRSVHLCDSAPPYPPVVLRLKRMLAASEIERSAIADVGRYIDDRLLRYAYWLLARGDRAELARFLQQEAFMSRRARFHASVLKTLLPIVPLRLIVAVNVRAERLQHRIAAARRRIPSEPTICARIIPPVHNSLA